MDECLNGLGVGITNSSVASDVASGLMNEHVAAAFLGYSVRALQNWRLRGGGPQYVKVSEKSVRYQRRDLQAWIDARLCPGNTPRRSGHSHDPTVTSGLDRPVSAPLAEIAD